MNCGNERARDDLRHDCGAEVGTKFGGFELLEPTGTPQPKRGSTCITPRKIVGHEICPDLSTKDKAPQCFSHVRAL